MEITTPRSQSSRVADPIDKPPATAAPPAKKPKKRPVEQTFEEPRYLRQLIESGATVTVRLRSNEEVSGVIEYYDANFIRLTRRGEPNLFIFKHDIKYLFETP
jgi:host factor-I protein